MALTDANGNVLSKSALQAKASTVTQPTVRKFNEDIYETTTFRGDATTGTRKRKKFYAGQVVSDAEIDALDAYANAGTVTSVVPSTGLATAGGTTVTINGTNLDGVTSVTFGGTAGTALKKISKTKITVVTPAKTAGSHAVVVVDDGSNIAAGNVTFA